MNGCKDKSPELQATLSTQVTIFDLRAELDRFGKDILQPELNILRESLLSCRSPLQDTPVRSEKHERKRTQHFDRSPAVEVESTGEPHECKRNELGYALVDRAPTRQCSPLTRSPSRYHDFEVPMAVTVAGSQTQVFLLDQQEAFVREDSNNRGPMTVVELQDGSLRGWNKYLQEVVLHPYFDMAVCALVLINVTFNAVQADYMARMWTLDSPAAFHRGNEIFCILFVVEITLRLNALGRGFFSFWRNWMDLVITLMQVAEVGLAMTMSATSRNHTLGRLRFLRLLRVLRMARIARAFALLSELRVLIMQIVSCLRGLLWTMLLLFMLTFALGVTLTQLVTEHKVSTGKDFDIKSDNNAQILMFYDTLELSMLTLYEATTDGVAWGEAVRPLHEECSPWWSIIFIIYIGFVTFAMLNVVTASFVSTAFKYAEEDGRSTMLDQLWNHFDSLGCDVTEDVFYEHVCDQDMRKLLNVLDLSGEEAKDARLFELIDTDRSGVLDSDELARGCVRLCGPARAIDLAAVKNDLHHDLHELKKQLASMGLRSGSRFNL